MRRRTFSNRRVRAPAARDPISNVHACASPGTRNGLTISAKQTKLRPPTTEASSGSLLLLPRLSRISFIFMFPILGACMRSTSKKRRNEGRERRIGNSEHRLADFAARDTAPTTPSRFRSGKSSCRTRAGLFGCSFRFSHLSIVLYFLFFKTDSPSCARSPGTFSRRFYEVGILHSRFDVCFSSLPSLFQKESGRPGTFLLDLFFLFLCRCCLGADRGTGSIVELSGKVRGGRLQAGILKASGKSVIVVIQMRPSWFSSTCCACSYQFILYPRAISIETLCFPVSH